MGDLSLENGYKIAHIFGEAQDRGPGGGVCQVASTLYNALLKADLEILERHPHSQPIDYLPEGEDKVRVTLLTARFQLPFARNSSTN